MKIIQLRTENVKRIKAVEINPSGALVVIKGNNGQGKTSVIDSIEMALGGKKAIPSRPVRDGEESARIDLDLGSLKIERVIKRDGTSALKVTGQEGAKLQSPQAILDVLVGSLSFDPLAFARMKPAEQAETMRKIAGLDFSALDEQRARLFAERTEINRTARAALARLDGNPEREEIPPDVDSLAAVNAAIDARESIRFANVNEAKAEACDGIIANDVRQIERLKNEIEIIERRISENKHAAANLRREADLARERAGNIEELERIAESAAQHNGANIAKRDRDRRIDEYEAFVEEANKRTDLIEQIDADKERVIKGAKLPLDGLGFDDEGVTMNGLPFAQASGAEQLRVSAAIGLALNPRLRVMLIRDGSLLDEDSLRMLGEFAEANDAQIWMERVGNHDACGVLIEDGEVAS